MTGPCGPPVTNIIPGWQQFIFSVNTSNPGQTDFRGQFENWPASPSFAAYANPKPPPPAYLTGSDLINLSQDAGPLSTKGIAGIPAGFQLVISLGTDSGNNVNSATFTATNNNIANGPAVSTTITPLGPSPSGTFPQQLDTSLPSNRQGAIQQQDLAPILAFQLVLVGLDGNQALLSSGEGTITYAASVPLTVQNTPPSCISLTITGEGANSVYGQLPQGASTPIKQSFAVTPATWSTSANAYQPAPASCSFIMRRTTFGKDDVAETIATAGGVFQQAFFITVGGLKPTDFPSYNGGAGITELISSSQTPTQQQLDELATWAPSIGTIYDVNGNPTNITVQATAVSSDDPLFGPQAQVFTFTYSIAFPDESAFTSLPASDYPELLTLTASLTPAPVPAGPLSVSGATLTAQAQIELITSADPFFSSEANGGLSWLCEDLRAFYLEENATLFGLTLGNAQTPTPLSFIQQVVSSMSGSNGSVPGSSDTFENLPHATGQDSQLSLLPTTASGTPVYNFALARVRLTGVTEAAQKVRVFFRTWQAQTTAVTYTTAAAGAGPSPATGPFRQYSDGVDEGRKVPLLGLSSDGTEYITVPFFATGRVLPGIDMTTQPEDSPYNAKPMSPPTGGGTTYAYFGAWLDTNQGTNQFPLQPPATNPDGENGSFNGLMFGTISQLYRGLHQCLVAEIVDDEAPIINNATPATSDKIAQRNLAFSVIANPGVSESRLATHTFEITPSFTGFNADQRPDELMIDWRNVPAGSVASIYLPAVNVSDIVALADAMYFTHDLHVSDPHTLQCPTGGITYIPIPEGSEANYAGLFSVQLPPGVRRGQAFEIVVHQVTGVAGDRDTNVVAGGTGSRQVRRIRGSFQIAIPVSTKAEMLIPEERDLSVMKWVQETIPASSRWYPVFLRYIEQLSNRVTALGGSGKLVPPTRTGIWPGLPKTGPGAGHQTHDRRECTGKVDAIVYDHFGGFKAFVIETFEGERRRFESHEAAVLELVQRARERRILTTVISSDDRPERPLEIILHGSPPPSGAS